MRAIADVLLRHGSELAPQRVERVAVETPGARFEPARIDQMRRAYLGDVHLQRRVLAHEHARRAGMVEMDVREQQVPQVLELEPALRREPSAGARGMTWARSRRGPVRPRFRGGRSR